MNSKSNSVILKSKLALLGFAFLMPLQSHAGSSTGTMLVSATVLTACTVGVSALTFGSYDTIVGATATSNVDVICTGSSSYALTINKGIGTGATFASRKLTGPTQLVNYSIYTDSAHTTVWGDGTSGTSTVTGTGILGIKSHPVYGKIPAGQPGDQGLYADTLTVNLTY